MLATLKQTTDGAGLRQCVFADRGGLRAAGDFVPVVWFAGNGERVSLSDRNRVHAQTLHLGSLAVPGRADQPAKADARTRGLNITLTDPMGADLSFVD